MKYTPSDFINMKNKEQITMLTCYDAMTAHILESVDIDIILVGDSAANVFLGSDSTKDITIDQMCYHVEAVRNGAPQTHIVADLNYLSCETVFKATRAAKALLKAGADSIKIEGFDPAIIFAIQDMGIPFVGHVGLLPQTAQTFKVTGKDIESSMKIVSDAHNLEKAGAFMIVAECVPKQLATTLQNSVTIPIIGIGAGNEVDGQVLVINDLLGFTSHTPRFVRKFSNMNEIIYNATKEYINAVKKRKFPSDEECYH